MFEFCSLGVPHTSFDFIKTIGLREVQLSSTDLNKQRSSEQFFTMFFSHAFTILHINHFHSHFAKRLALDNADATGYSPSKPRGWTRALP